MRFYNKDNKKYISVTTILDLMFPFNKEAFNKWCEFQGLSSDRILTLSKILGSKVSDWFKCEFNNLQTLSPVVITQHERGLRQAVDKFLESYELLACEQTVYNDEYGYAGTLDGIIKHKDTGKIYMADWKTFGAWKPVDTIEYKRNNKKIKKASIQIDMYAEAIGNKEINRAVVVFIPNGEYDFVEVKPNDVWREWIDNHKEEINI